MTKTTDITELRGLDHFFRTFGRMPDFHESNGLLRTCVGKPAKKTTTVPVTSIPFAPVRMLGTVAAGFPSPAEEELVDSLSLDELLIENREATFMIRVAGDSMSGAGILPGDIVLVDKGRTPQSGDIVIAEVDGEWTMKYLRKRGDTITLVAANPRYPPLRPKRELKVGGVITAVIRKY